MPAVNGLELKTPGECERIHGDNDRLIGHSCRKCGLLYTTKQYRDDHQQRAETCCSEKPCPGCGKKTILITADTWHPHTGDDKEWVEIEEEVSGHWCEQCRKLTTLCLNL